MSAIIENNNFRNTSLYTCNNDNKKVLWMHYVSPTYLLYLYSNNNETIIELTKESDFTITDSLILNINAEGSKVHPIIKNEKLIGICITLKEIQNMMSDYEWLYDVGDSIIILCNLSEEKLKLSHIIHHPPVIDLESPLHSVLVINSKLYYFGGILNTNTNVSNPPYNIFYLYPLTIDENQTQELSVVNMGNKIPICFEFMNIPKNGYFNNLYVIHENKFIIQHNNLIYIQIFNETDNGIITFTTDKINVEYIYCNNMFYLPSLNIISISNSEYVDLPDINDNFETPNEYYALSFYNLDGTPSNYKLKEEANVPCNKYVIKTNYTYSKMERLYCSDCGIIHSIRGHDYCSGHIYRERDENVQNMENGFRTNNYTVSSEPITIINCLGYSQNRVIFQICDLLISLDLCTGEEEIMHDIPDKKYHTTYVNINACVDGDNIYLCKNNPIGYTKIWSVFRERVSLLEVHDSLEKINAPDNIKQLLEDPYYIRDLAEYL